MVRTVGRKPGVSAWGCAWLAAAGTWTRISVRGCSPMGPEDASVRLGGVASGGENAEKRRVHVPCAAGTPRGEQRVSEDVRGWSFGFRVQGAGGYGAFVAVQRGPAGLPGRGSTCPA